MKLLLTAMLSMIAILLFAIRLHGAVEDREQPLPVRLALIYFALLLLPLAGLVACGGSSGGGGGGRPYNPGTPTGAYTVTVTGSVPSAGTTVQHSLSLKLTVQ